VVWVGAGIFTGRYGGAAGIARVLAIVYIGVTVSDMVTFFLGSALRRGLFKTLKQRLFKEPAVVERAESVVQKWSKMIGLVQRFSLGFRGPLCLVAGFLGVNPAVFASGVAAGAFGTMALQILAGYLLRFSPNAYLAALALVAAPNLVGHLAGPVLTAVGLWSASRDPNGSAPDDKSSQGPDTFGGQTLGKGVG
jgi:membrane protein DedA with SNARE-associated domain